MDNARIHHGAGILELAERFGGSSPMLSILNELIITTRIGIRIEFLPPYSPDLNPIEEAFSKIKAFIWRHRLLLSRRGDGMIFELMEIMNIITGDDAIGYFVHAGYF
jgi:transposase